MFGVFRILCFLFCFVLFISLIWGQFFSGMQILYNVQRWPSLKHKSLPRSNPLSCFPFPSSFCFLISFHNSNSTHILGSPQSKIVSIPEKASFFLSLLHSWHSITPSQTISLPSLFTWTTLTHLKTPLNNLTLQSLPSCCLVTSPVWLFAAPQDCKQYLSLSFTVSQSFAFKTSPDISVPMALYSHHRYWVCLVA